MFVFNRKIFIVEFVGGDLNSVRSVVFLGKLNVLVNVRIQSRAWGGEIGGNWGQKERI